MEVLATGELIAVTLSGCRRLPIRIMQVTCPAGIAISALEKLASTHQRTARRRAVAGRNLEQPVVEGAPVAIRRHFDRPRLLLRHLRICCGTIAAARRVDQCRDDRVIRQFKVADIEVLPYDADIAAITGVSSRARKSRRSEYPRGSRSRHLVAGMVVGPPIGPVLILIGRHRDSGPVA